MIETARAVTGREIKTRLASRRPGDPARLVGSAEKIKRELDWQPKFQNLQVIIQSAWDWLCAHPQGYGG